MEREIQAGDICVCCGKPVPEGRMVCYACETVTDTVAPYGTVKQSKGIKRMLGMKKERKNESRK